MSSLAPHQPTVTPPGPVPTTRPPRSARTLALVGAVTLTQGWLLFVPVAVLGVAIGWPGSLADPASTALPRILENEAAVRLGYLVYLLYSVLFAVTVVLLVDLVRHRLGWAAVQLAVGFAVASAVARSVGIVRWLVPAPESARLAAEAPTEVDRAAVEAAFDAVDAWGGTVGELLGVGLFAAVAVGTLAVGLLRHPGVPRWVGLGAVVAAGAVAVPAVELAGVDPGVVLTVSVAVLQVWLLATGGWLLHTARHRQDGWQP